MELVKEKIAFKKPDSWSEYVKLQPLETQSISQKFYPIEELVEREVLAGMIDNPTCFYEGIKHLKADYFEDEIRRYVFELMQFMFEKKIEPKLTDFQIENKRKKNIPCFYYTIAELSSAVSYMPIINFDSRIKMLKENYIVKLYNEKVSKKSSFEDVLSSFDLYDLVNAELTGMGEAVHISEVANRSHKQLLERQKALKEGKTVGISSGIDALDSKTCGFRSGELVIIAARPSMGKTALALFMAKKAAQAGKFVTFFSLEMEDVSLYDRLVLSESGVDAQRYKTKILEEYEMQMLLNAGKKLTSNYFYIDDQPKVNLNYIKTTTTLKRNIGQCDLIVIDYLQLADVNKKGLTREQAIAETTRELKILAKDLGIPIILLSQLNREVDNDSANLYVPQLSNLRESGAIEQDADTVLLLTRPAYYNVTLEALGKKYKKLSFGLTSTEGLMIINIAKQRSGSTGLTVCGHNKPINNFYDI